MVSPAAAGSIVLLKKPMMLASNLCFQGGVMTESQELELRSRWGDAAFEWWHWWVTLGLSCIEGHRTHKGPRWWAFVVCKRIAGGWWAV